MRRDVRPVTLTQAQRSGLEQLHVALHEDDGFLRTGNWRTGSVSSTSVRALVDRGLAAYLPKDVPHDPAYARITLAGVLALRGQEAA